MQTISPFYDCNNFKLGSPDLQHMSKWAKYWYRKRARQRQYLKDPPNTYKFDKEIYANTGKIVRIEDNK